MKIADHVIENDGSLEDLNVEALGRLISRLLYIYIYIYTCIHIYIYIYIHTLVYLADYHYIFVDLAGHGRLSHVQALGSLARRTLTYDYIASLNVETKIRTHILPALPNHKLQHTYIKQHKNKHTRQR